ncbi:hypothetical protein Pst134EA_019282 [Puccinia striiformis f. sp. tritici]|uniref:hypothetical protein n=1 Tax=Puccinia striiformis f. sp. tritici TaxID=168172 RepID=UPI0020082E02|nr:hypothetical protein Pst134EA_019282 [Puccinia striiformis f. sp. tritici]KAH9459127.1 hypothetical protein Pst134EA_019282 [Puccinia striiformis f. sp. tritici]
MVILIQGTFVRADFKCLDKSKPVGYCTLDGAPVPVTPGKPYTMTKAPQSDDKKGFTCSGRVLESCCTKKFKPENPLSKVTYGSSCKTVGNV